MPLASLGAFANSREEAIPVDRRPDRTNRSDPTRMANQPSLQTSRGRIWIVVGGLFAVLSLVPFTALVVSGSPAAPVATAAGALVILLYATMLVLRFAIPNRTRRLRLLAACLLALAAVALLGAIVCALVAASAAGAV
ncbi:hypothetical protein D3248_13715 [Leucobacter zeae]|nr:hypothetical protein [Leucobacter zeae]